MRYRIAYSAPAQLVDRDRTVISSEPLVQKLDGLACVSDSVLAYVELDFAQECQFRGGHPRLAVDQKARLWISLEVDSQQELTRKQLKELQQDFEGQLTDGIGAGCFNELTAATGLSVEFLFPVKAKCVQTEGTAWRPAASAGKGNEKKIAAAAKLLATIDSSVPRKSAAKKTSSEGPRPVVVSAQREKPNLQALFRLLGKPERDQLFDQIKAELQNCGNDLSMVGDREYPSGNFNDTKLLRWLLKAGLSPETTDVKGNSLLIQAAGSPGCVELLLKEGAAVNRVCDDLLATALMRAAFLGKRKSVEVLLEHGADPSLRNKSGKTAEDVVDKRSRERQAIIDLLRRNA